MKTLILVFSFNFLLSQILQGQNSNINVVAYDINVKISKSSETVDIVLLCKLSVNNPTGRLQFIFSSDAVLHAVKLLKNKDWINVPFEFTGKDSLLLTTGNSLARDNMYSFKFDYSFPTGLLNDTLLYLDRGHRWYPLIMDQIAPFKLTCEVPKGYSVLSAGDLLEIDSTRDKSVFIWESSLPVFKLPLILFTPGTIKKISDGKIDLYYSSINSANAKMIITKANEIVTYYNNVGVFPYNKLTMFEIKDFPGVNTCSGLLMIGTQSLEAIAHGDEDIIILTIAQQWFGSGVFARFGEKGFFFLSLSLPHYLRLMFIRQEQGEEVFQKSLLDPLTGYKEFAGTENDIPIIDVDLPNSREKGLILYAKAPFVLSKIEKELGRDKWLLFIRNLYHSFHGKILSFEEFSKSLAKYDANGDVLTLLNKLMTGKGMPIE
ncbi:MAG: hypothetical protein Q8N83_14020 [Ignavibacteria bacterium]|nr:hypothetical protein [Ignavibacteria bacterium]